MHIALGILFYMRHKVTTRTKKNYPRIPIKALLFVLFHFFAGISLDQNSWNVDRFYLPDAAKGKKGT